MQAISSVIYCAWKQRFLVILGGCLCCIVSCSNLGLRTIPNPNAPLSLSVRSVDFEGASTNQIVLRLHGFVKNPNIEEIQRVGFTYETFVGSKRVESGRVDSNPSFLFKSRTEFTLPVRIPTRFLGGYVQASTSDGVDYKVTLLLTDSRLIRTKLTYINKVNLSSLLALPILRLSAQVFDDQPVITLSVTNPNNFVFVVDTCLLVVNDDPISRQYEVFTEAAFAAQGTQSAYTAITYPVPIGTVLSVQATCMIDGSEITYTDEIIATKGDTL